ncbi:MAG TPA: hypothetical protein DCG60_08930 [Tissierella sp.]|uniref:hypothetical protein n=1 Tax=Tissierella praeacuta TaxID=43131 RepID=UPI000EBE528F|nr:hypothetical protein [Tissierella praeacuta]HAE92747.1 hypothetical protein [Tissierella sp.]
MSSKKINLSTQYVLKALIVFMILILYIVNIEEFGFKEYKSIISRIYNIGLLSYYIIGLIRKNEEIDESAEKILSKVNKICLNMTLAGWIFLFLLLGEPIYNEIVIPRDTIGLIMLIILFIIVSLRAILFYYYDRKGL